MRGCGRAGTAGTGYHPPPYRSPPGSAAAGAGAVPAEGTITVPGHRREKRQGRSIPLFDGLTISMGKDIPCGTVPGRHRSGRRLTGRPQPEGHGAEAQGPPGLGLRPQGREDGPSRLRSLLRGIRGREGGGHPRPREPETGGELQRMTGIPGRMTPPSPVAGSV